MVFSLGNERKHLGKEQNSNCFVGRLKSPIQIRMLNLLEKILIPLQHLL